HRFPCDSMLFQVTWGRHSCLPILLADKNVCPTIALGSLTILRVSACGELTPRRLQNRETSTAGRDGRPIPKSCIQCSSGRGRRADTARVLLLREQGDRLGQ